MGQESARQADERTQTVVRQAARGVFEVFAAVGRVPEPWQAVAGALLVARPAGDQVEAAVEVVLDVLAARVAGLAQLPLCLLYTSDAADE